MFTRNCSHKENTICTIGTEFYTDIRAGTIIIMSTKNNIIIIGPSNFVPACSASLFVICFLSSKASTASYSSNSSNPFVHFLKLVLNNVLNFKYGSNFILCPKCSNAFISVTPLHISFHVIHHSS